MHQWVVLKNNIKIYIKIYIKTAPTCFGVTVTPSSGSALIRLQPGLNPRTWVLKASALPLDHRSRHIKHIIIQNNKGELGKKLKLFWRFIKCVVTCWYIEPPFNVSARVFLRKRKIVISWISTLVPCSILILSTFYLYSNWCTSELSWKTILKFILKFTLKQLRHVSVLQLHHHQGAH